MSLTRPTPAFTARRHAAVPCGTAGMLGVLVALTACTGLPPGAGSLPAATPTPAVVAWPTEPVAVVVTASDFGYAPQRVRVPLGRTVVLRFENHGKLDHDWLVRPLGLHLHALPGKQVEVTTSFAKPGLYPIVCSYPSHEDFGMVGEFEVLATPEVPAALAEGPIEPAAAATPVALGPLPPGVGRLPPPVIAPPVDRQDARVVAIQLTPKEVDVVVDEGVATRLWTYNGTVPGPMFRAREGDTVKVVFSNPITNRETHSVDFHAVTGPHGGAMATQVAPGGRAELTFKALRPGVYMYHCGTPRASYHVAHGMYGLFAVEPAEGWPKVDREVYLMQGELYLAGGPEARGLRPITWPELATERPDRVVMNGAVGALTGERAARAGVGDTVRLFFGVGGPNLGSSFHAIGEVFDEVYPDGAKTAQRNVSIAAVPPGGAARIEMTTEVPGTYPLVDHALSRVDRGAMAELIVTGEARPDLFLPGVITPISHLHGEGDHKGHGHGEEGVHNHGDMP